MNKQSKGLRDLLLFFAVAGLPIAGFLLQDYPDTQFFTILLLVFMGVLLWLRQYHKESHFDRLVDYDENMGFGELLVSGIGVFGTYIVASVIVSAFAISSIYIPRGGLGIEVGPWQLSGMWNDVLFNIVLVASAEELCKLVLHIACYIKLKGALGETWGRAVSIVAPILAWSMLHAYSAYTGPNMGILLFSAFVGGLVIYGVLWKTKSLLGAIFTHAGYNCLIIYLNYANGIVP